MHYFHCFRFQSELYVAYYPDKNCLVGNTDLESVKGTITDYKGYQAASGTWAVSGTIHWMQFQPCILAFENPDDIREMFLDLQAYEISTHAGHYVGIKLKPEALDKLFWEPTPYITKEDGHVKPFYEK